MSIVERIRGSMEAVSPESELIRDATGKCATDALPALQQYADRVGLPLEEARFLFNRRMEKVGL